MSDGSHGAAGRLLVDILSRAAEAVGGNVRRCYEKCLKVTETRSDPQRAE